MDKEDVESFLGVQVTHYEYRSIEFTQPALIQCIINVLGLKDDSNMHDTPMAFKTELSPAGPCSKS